MIHDLTSNNKFMSLDSSCCRIRLNWPVKIWQIVKSKLSKFLSNIKNWEMKWSKWLINQHKPNNIVWNFLEPPLNLLLAKICLMYSSRPKYSNIVEMLFLNKMLKTKKIFNYDIIITLFEVSFLLIEVAQHF